MGARNAISRYPFEAPIPAVGQYLFPVAQNVATTSNSQGNGTLRLAPWLIARKLTIDRIGADIDTAGQSGAKLRLGIYADTGGCFPGALLVDAGQVAADTSAMVEALLGTALALGPGLVWIGAAVQAAATTQPSVRTTTSGWTPPVPLGLGTAAPGQNTTLVGYSQTGVTAALPATFTGGGLAGSVPRLHVKRSA